MLFNRITRWGGALQTRRGQRILRRIVFPVSIAALVSALGLAGFARLGGSPASAERPFTWDGGTVFVAGSVTPDVYTTCTITYGDGDRRDVEVPGQTGGLRLTTWFDGAGSMVCGRSVSVTTGWQSILYPLAENRTVTVLLAVVAGASWWLGRGAKASVGRKRT
ncbi:hypothetical protein FB566_3936 [Stackebrandtia endophytica]|uniref:Uncharacterized protein n=1 Tax=Stackebrandtia endophytica TaxID=1496996 RepID=A0A543B0J3_9ACTN|nr:hypothetical protein [Stackebrandtia endophytica]TQL78353.1 hypothetical protein FB566_3936 [Stackebrandtia endophytica]